jgi:preprotein translocase subunit SecE
MARDRKRAKQRQRQRRSRREAERVAARPEAQAPALPQDESAPALPADEPAPALPTDEPAPALPADEPDTVLDAPPDPVEHASGDAEIAEAAEHALPELDGPTTPLQEDEYPQPDELEGADALQEQEPQELAPDRRRSRARQPRATPGRELPREGNRFVNFLRACWAELQRVQWPDRRQVAQATGVVLVFVLIAGGYLGLLDAIFSRVVNAIL